MCGEAEEAQGHSGQGRRDRETETRQFCCNCAAFFAFPPLAACANAHSLPLLPSLSLPLTRPSKGVLSLMYFPSIRLGSWKHALASGRNANLGRTGSATPLADFPRHRRHGGSRRRATDTCRSVGGSRFVSGRAEESVQSEGGRQYTSWSPSTRKDTSANLLPAEEGQQPQRQRRLQQHHQQQPPPSPVKPRVPNKSPQAVSMEEFAALERKLAPPVLVQPPRRKTPEQVAMEEFAALDRKLRPNPGEAASVGSHSGSRGARQSPLTKPEVSVTPRLPWPRYSGKDRFVDGRTAQCRHPVVPVRRLIDIIAFTWYVPRYPRQTALGCRCITSTHLKLQELAMFPPGLPTVPRWLSS